MNDRRAKRVRDSDLTGRVFSWDRISIFSLLLQNFVVATETHGQMN